MSNKLHSKSGSPNRLHLVPGFNVQLSPARRPKGNIPSRKEEGGEREVHDSQEVNNTSLRKFWKLVKFIRSSQAVMGIVTNYWWKRLSSPAAGEA